MTAPIPRATYRLQFHAGFRLVDAVELVPYLHALGISHLYASPYLKARSGSQHGYDVVDHNALNPEVGTTADLERLSRTLATHGMSQIVDVVPNHMGVLHNENLWWMDVVENGPASPWSDTFDIDWSTDGPAGEPQLLLPVLGSQYGQALEQGDLALAYRPDTGTFVIAYYEHDVPVRPQDVAAILRSAPMPFAADDADKAEAERLLGAFEAVPRQRGMGRAQREVIYAERCELKAAWRGFATRCGWVAGWTEDCLRRFNGTPGEPASFDALHALLERQAWRLAYWRVAADEVNYRRFFEVTTLAALRMEDRGVFDETHRMVMRWLAEQKLTGLRIDHPDGLAEPREYFERLQAAYAAGEAAAGRPATALYVAIEKILASHEHWPDDWPVHGDTGYQYAQLVNNVFVDPRNEAAFDALYAEFVGRVPDYEAESIDAKRYVIFRLLASDLQGLTKMVLRIAHEARTTRDYTYNGIRSALVELAAGMPVYRTYIGQDGVHDIDRRHLEWAASTARRRGALTEDATLAYVVDLMTDAQAMTPDRLAFVRRFQQFTAPVMAKAVEDTAFYRYHRLISLNDVGGDPREFGITVSAFHGANRARARHLPHCMLGSSTHDSKRSEDVRTRLDVLSEMPQAFAAALGRWRQLRRRQVPPMEDAPSLDPNDEMLLYQTLVGAWPLEEIDATGLAELRGRLQAYMLKALREAKQNTSWLRPDAAYEAEVARGIDALLGQLEPNPFLTDLRGFVDALAPYGCANSLSLVALKLTSPGLPDVYQGCETWNLSLVDPDNRRPVDFALRRTQLADLQAATAGGGGLPPDTLARWREQWRDGRLKLLVTSRLLAFRAQASALMTHGAYEPLEATGGAASHVIAYARSDTDTGSAAVTIATRLLYTLLESHRDRGPFGDGGSAWEDTELQMPAGEHQNWEDVITGRRFTATLRDGAWWLPLSDVLSALPVAQLWRVSSNNPEAGAVPS